MNMLMRFQQKVLYHIDMVMQIFLVSDIHNKKGRVNYNGQLTIPFEYDTLFHFNDTTIIATKGNRYGLISRENQIIKPFEYRKIYQLTSDLVFINKEGKAGIYDEEGKIKIPFEYDAIYDTFYNDFDPLKTKYIVIKEGKVGTIDIHNNIVIPIIYDGLSGWVEYGPDAHFVKNKGKYGLISHEGKIIIPIEYDYVDIPLPESSGSVGMENTESYHGKTKKSCHAYTIISLMTSRTLTLKNKKGN